MEAKRSIICDQENSLSEACVGSGFSHWRSFPIGRFAIPADEERGPAGTGDKLESGVRGS